MAIDIIMAESVSEMYKAEDQDVEMMDVDAPVPKQFSGYSSTSSSSLRSSTDESLVDSFDEGEIIDSASPPSIRRPVFRYSTVLKPRRSQLSRDREEFSPARRPTPGTNFRRVSTAPHALVGQPQRLRYPDYYTGPGPTNEVADLFGNLRMEGGRPERRNDHGHRRNYNNHGGGGYNGGGGGGHGGNRKRRFREDDQDDRPARRNRYEEPVASRLRREIVLIAEKGNVIEFASKTGKAIADNFADDDQVRGPFLDTVIELICEQPLKIPHVAAVFLYANDINGEVTKEALQKVQTRAQESLDNGDWRQFKLLLRFLACLQPIFQGDGVFPLLNELFNRAADQQTASQDDVVGLEIVKIILLTLPYAIVSGAANLEDKVQAILQKTDIIAAVQHSLESLAEPYPLDQDRPFGFQSVLDLLQKQLAREAENGWKLACLPRIYKRPIKEENADGDAMNGVEKSLATQSFPIFSIPNPANPGKRALLPETFLSLYADQEIESVPHTEVIASSLIRDAMADTINILDFNRHAVAKFLIEVDNYFTPGTFARRGTSFDKLKDLPEGQSNWKTEDVAIDAVFSQMLLLPSAVHKLVYYHSVITEACKLAPGAIAPTLGRAIRFLYRHIDSMDLELSYRFLDWFSHHLSNFDFRWKWTEWTEDVDTADANPKHAFITGAIDKEIRLSFPKRIKEALPPDYHKLISKGKFLDTPEFKYKEDDTPYAPEGRQILAMLKKKVPETEIQPVIDAIEQQATEYGIADPLIPSTDAYMTAVCFIGSKSLSHVLSCIDRCKVRLLEVGAKSEQARRQIIQSVVDYWKDLPGTAVNIVDKLLNFTIVTPDSVIHWCLGQPSLGVGIPLSQSWRFEMVAATMGKITHRMRQIVAARVQALGMEAAASEQITLLDETIAKERQSMGALFALVEELLAVYASGAADAFIEGADGVTDQDLDSIKAWALRWLEVFRRKAAVEETVVGEAAVAATLINAKVEFERAEAKRKQDEEEREKRRAEAEERRVKAEEEEEKKKLENGSTAKQTNGAADVLDEADDDI